MQPSTFLIIAQDAKGETDSPVNLVVLALTVLGAALTVGKDLVGFLQTRVRHTAPSQPAFKVLRLRMSKATESVVEKQQGYKLLFGLMALQSAFILVFIPIIYFVFVGVGLHRWTVVVGIVGAGINLLVCGNYYLQLRRVAPGNPVTSKKAALVVQADLDDLVKQCQLSFADLHAITIEESQVRVAGACRATLQGGTGGWPFEGQRITIRIRKLSQGCCFILIESASFLPGRFQRRNASNVLRVVRRLI